MIGRNMAARDAGMDTIRKEDRKTNMRIAMLFWVVTPCRLVGRYQRFGGTYRLKTWRWR
jgi:hypothetical protein